MKAFKNNVGKGENAGIRFGKSRKYVGKGENAGNQHFLLFPQCFLLFPKLISIFSQIYFVFFPLGLVYNFLVWESGKPL